MAGTVTWTGAAELDKKLKRLGGSASKRMAGQMVNAAMNPIVRGIKDEINGTNVQTKGKTDSSGLKHSARQTIGKRLARERGATSPVPNAKAGFSVGKGGAKRVKSQQKKSAHRVGNQIQRGKGDKARSMNVGGVGISSQNIHWAVMGTKKRVRWSGGKTGAMPAIFEQVVPKAVRGSARAAFSVAKTKLRNVLLKEALRKV